MSHFGIFWQSGKIYDAVTKTSRFDYAETHKKSQQFAVFNIEVMKISRKEFFLSATNPVFLFQSFLIL